MQNKTTVSFNAGRLSLNIKKSWLYHVAVCFALEILKLPTHACSLYSMWTWPEHHRVYVYNLFSPTNILPLYSIWAKHNLKSNVGPWNQIFKHNSKKHLNRYFSPSPATQQQWRSWSSSPSAWPPPLLWNASKRRAPTWVSSYKDTLLTEWLAIWRVSNRSRVQSEVTPCFTSDPWSRKINWGSNPFPSYRRIGSVESMTQRTGSVRWRLRPV